MSTDTKVTDKRSVDAEWVEVETTEPIESLAGDGTKKKKGTAVADILPWVGRLQGNISAIADAMGCGRSTIYRRIQESDELQMAIDSERERTLDQLEETLATQAINGNIPALIFALKTQGRARGYGDKVEVEGWGDGRKRDTEADAVYLLAVLEEAKRRMAGGGKELEAGDSAT